MPRPSQPPEFYYCNSNRWATRISFFQTVQVLHSQQETTFHTHTKPKEKMKLFFWAAWTSGFWKVVEILYSVSNHVNLKLGVRFRIFCWIRENTSAAEENVACCTIVRVAQPCTMQAKLLCYCFRLKDRFLLLFLHVSTETQCRFRSTKRGCKTKCQ